MVKYDLGCGKDFCDCDISKDKGKRGSFDKVVRYTFYGIAVGILLYTSYLQFFDNPNEEKVKVEQVGKSIDNKLE